MTVATDDLAHDIERLKALVLAERAEKMQLAGECDAGCSAFDNGHLIGRNLGRPDQRPAGRLSRWFGTYRWQFDVMGHVWTAPGCQGFLAVCSVGRCSHVSGL